MWKNRSFQQALFHRLLILVDGVEKCSFPHWVFHRRQGSAACGIFLVFHIQFSTCGKVVFSTDSFPQGTWLRSWTYLLIVCQSAFRLGAFVPSLLPCFPSGHRVGGWSVRGLASLLKTYQRFSLSNRTKSGVLIVCTVQGCCDGGRHEKPDRLTADGLTVPLLRWWRCPGAMMFPGLIRLKMSNEGD